MDALIQSLPVNTQTGSATLMLINSYPGTETNTYTSQNIIDANAKNWRVYDYNGGLGLYYLEIKP